MQLSDSASSMLASSSRARSISFAEFSSGGASTTTSSCFSAGNTPRTLDVDWSVSPARHGKQREQYGEHAPAHSYFALPGAVAHHGNGHRQHTELNCAQQPPHQHSDAGFCLPPAMTLCNSSHCGEEWHAHGQQSTRTLPHQPHTHQTHHHPFAFVPPPPSGRSGWNALDFQQRNSPVAMPPASPAETHICQWAGCGHHASSVAELVAHVHFAHLAGPQAPAQQQQSHLNHFGHAQAAPVAQQMQPPQQVCQWDSCSVAAPNMPHDTSGAGVLQHLLTAHLGREDSDPSALLAAFFGGEQMPSSATPAARGPAYTAADIPTGKRRRLTQAAESIVHKSAPSHLDRAAAGFSNTTSPHATTTPGSSTHATPAPDNGGAHRCGWVGCGQLFESHAALTEHLGAAHVGSGHTEYACGWERCERARTGQTFSQRQKVMRHLQTHTGERGGKVSLGSR
jgi:hypothetical protein